MKGTTKAFIIGLAVGAALHMVVEKSRGAA